MWKRLLLFALLQRLLPSLVAPVLTENPTPLQAALRDFHPDRSLSRLIWMVHPVHSAAVDYILGRADSLAFFFAAGSWLLFLPPAEELRVDSFPLHLLAVSLLLALCSRERLYVGDRFSVSPLRFREEIFAPRKILRSRRMLAWWQFMPAFANFPTNGRTESQ